MKHEVWKMDNTTADTSYYAFHLVTLVQVNQGDYSDVCMLCVWGKQICMKFQFQKLLASEEMEWCSAWKWIQLGFDVTVIEPSGCITSKLFCVYAVPPLLVWLQNTATRNGKCLRTGLVA